MRILIAGANGQLGTELKSQLAGCDVFAFGRTDLDITSEDAVNRCVAEVMPDVVINAAAYTKVDLAEQEESLCRLVNVEAVGLLAAACDQFKAKFIHVSSDYVFGTDTNRITPYVETDTTGPQGVYAVSKRDGELEAAKCAQHFVVRTCGVYGVHDALASMTNFVNTMLRIGPQKDELNIVADQHCNPTFVSHLAEAIRFLATTNEYGTYHVVNGGEATWIEFAAEIFRLADIDIKLNPITTEEYGAPAARPGYSVLNTEKYHGLGGTVLPSWQDALAEALSRRLQTA